MCLGNVQWGQSLLHIGLSLSAHLEICMKYYLTGKQAQIVDKYTQESLGIPGIILMEKAAEKLADSIEMLLTKSFSKDSENKVFEKKILSIVESGNNGGDAVAASWMLKDRGYDTYIYEIGGISRKTESYLTEIEKAKEHGVTFVDFSGRLEDIAHYSIVIDGIFGVGLTREVSGIQKEVVEAINSCAALEKESRPIVVGVDIPSGISAGTGHILGTAVRCDATITFEYIKYGMLVNEGREYAGKIYCESIGLFVPKTPQEMASLLSKEGVGHLSDPDNMTAVLRDRVSLYVCYEFDESEIKDRLPKRKSDSNKGTYGKVLIVAGSKEVYGAVYLAAEATYRVGAGLVKVVTDIRNRDILCDKLPEAMMLTYDTERLQESSKKNILKNKQKECLDEVFIMDYKASIQWADIILAGPGLGTGDISLQLLSVLAETVSDKQKVVLDADALNIISSGENDIHFSSFVSKVGLGNVIITPHMMEMLRIVKSRYNKQTYDFMLSGLGYQSDMDFLKNYKKEQAYNLSYSEGIITVLKDARTLVAYKNTGDDEPGMEGYARDCELYVNTTGNSGMSKGGSGDVLAGMIAGLLAQNKNGSIKDTVCTAVHLHGRAGDMARDRVGERSMLARDIIDAIPDVLK
ncbi:NAD(P)H-hydrate epimerase [Lachnospiraceae bacterium NE2001]|nr:NAD(P)H-hydrate epimerase [Lachnospiraceae bacterium NE2001]